MASPPLSVSENKPFIFSPVHKSIANSSGAVGTSALQAIETFSTGSINNGAEVSTVVINCF